MRNEARGMFFGALIGLTLVSACFLHSLGRMNATLERIAVCLESATRIFRIGGR